MAWLAEARTGVTRGPVAVSTVKFGAAAVGVDDKGRDDPPVGTCRACKMATALPVVGVEPACAADKDGPPADDADANAVASAARAGGAAF